MVAKRILFLFSVILHQSYAPPPRQPKEAPPVEVQLDSGFTNTGDLYLTGGASLTHATYQNLDINRRKVKRQLHPKRSQRESQSSSFSVGFGRTCAAEIPCDVSANEYRTFDGSCNNIENPHFGQSETPFKRLEHKKYSLINCGNSPYLRLPNPRLASRIVFQRDEGSASMDIKNTIMVMTFGQMIDHDMQLTPLRQMENGSFLNCCEQENLNHVDCCPISVPTGDFFYGREGRTNCMGFIRSKTTNHPGRNCRRLPDIENANTAWIDASFLYGSDDEDALEHRDTQNGGGRLKTTVVNNTRQFPFMTKDEVTPMKFGDSRGDVLPSFTALHTVILRFHNDLADKLRQVNPRWNDEKLYQEARKIVGGVLQHITYTQFLNALLGFGNDVTVSQEGLHVHSYDPQVDGSIDLVFSTAAYRLHTYVSPMQELYNENLELVKEFLLRDVFHKPMKMIEEDNFDCLIRGLAKQPMGQFDNKFTTEMTEFLFARPENKFGLDIVALNIQRGRDHQLQGYTFYKNYCGFGPTWQWSDLEDLFDKESVHRLQHLYESPDDVDLYVGGFLERPILDSHLGPTFHCLVSQTFKKLKQGDRFFYNNDGIFTSSQLSEIKKQNLASVLCAGADEPQKMKFQPNVFELPNDSNNRMKACSDYPMINVEAWIEK